MLTYVGTRLSGRASEFFKQETFDNFEEFYSKFEDYFGEPKATPVILHEMHNFFQGDLSLREFIEKFEKQRQDLMNSTKSLITNCDHCTSGIDTCTKIMDSISSYEFIQNTHTRIKKKL